MNTIRWGILGPGKISGSFARGLHEAAGADLVAVGSRDQARAATFAVEYGVANVHGSYEELASDPEVDAIYIGTPHSFHCEHTLLCLRQGKHVLCEKPLAMNGFQAEQMIETARESRLVLMEAVWTRFLPAVVRVRELLEAGTIGKVQMVMADFGFRAEFDPDSRLFSPDLGGGALLDVGIYPLNLAFMVLGEPVEMQTMVNLGVTGVDEQSTILLRHQEGQLSVLSSSLVTDTTREAHILGTEGSITICFPWWAANRIVVKTADGSEKSEDLPRRGGGYTHEAEAFMELIRSRATDSEIMPLDESLNIMKTMDQIRARWGLKYPCE